jgi:hypothetical protein
MQAHDTPGPHFVDRNVQSVMVPPRRTARKALFDLGRSSGAILLLALSAASRAEPPAERTIVAAVADADAARILVRWRTEEGTARFSHYDVLRREADAPDSAQLNDDPIGPLVTVADIEAVFNAPDRADALGWITESLGADYAADLLRMHGPDAPPEAELQLLGTIYVYEVWGLDAEGFRVERLGRATATAGMPDVLPAPAGLVCADPGGFHGHLQASLRWSSQQTAQPYYGFDLERAEADVAGNCPPPGPGWVAANQFPVLGDAAGRVEEGKRLFAQRCAACHAGGRDGPPVLGSTRRDFRRRQYPAELCAGNEHVGLLDLTPRALSAIYDYIHEFQFRDDGEETPTDPLIAAQEYCYRVAARDLLGQPGLAATEKCGVEDRLPPAVPKQVKTTQVLSTAGNFETCEISWRVNRQQGDDTARYFLYRTRTELPGPCSAVPVDDLGFFDQPPVDDRIVTEDTGLLEADAGALFFYAVRAEDAAGNLSAYSGWVPCVPRDVKSPGSPGFDVVCPDSCQDPQDCEDHGQTGPGDPWFDAGGGPFVVADPGTCPPEIDVHTFDPDTFKVRTYRSFAGSDFKPGPDFLPSDAFGLLHRPLMDSKLCTKLRSYDKSGNFNADDPGSETCHLVRGSRPIPAPRIISVSEVDPATDEVQIRFRAMDPSLLIGFALYDQIFDPRHPDAPPIKGEHLQRVPDANLSDSPLEIVFPEDIAVCVDGLPSSIDARWAVKEAALALDQLLPLADPAGTLTYDDVKRVYELQTHLASGDGERLLFLVAVGWTGCEGKGQTFRWSETGRVPAGDGELDWPEHDAGNPVVLAGDAAAYDPDLVLIQDVGPSKIHVFWTPYPSCVVCTAPDVPPGCTDPDDPRAGPFAVFRRRAGAKSWQQISPLIDCWPDTSVNQMRFDDRDVQEDTWYTYTVVRQTKLGEFFMQHGPAYDAGGSTQFCFSEVGVADCGPEPE